jgi:opacity protein-like surface antigen
MRVQLAKVVLFAVCLLPTFSFGQFYVAFGYTHESGNNGVNGFTPEAGIQYGRAVTLLAQGDFLWNTSTLGAFTLVPSTGAIRVKSNTQNYLGGGRLNLTGWGPTKSLRRKKLTPYAELLFGESRLHQTVKSVQSSVSVEASSWGFTWVFGGGISYKLSPHWSARSYIDFVRTHFSDEGQSHWRFNAGLAYRF